jgi:hypothetical protein
VPLTRWNRTETDRARQYGPGDTPRLRTADFATPPGTPRRMRREEDRSREDEDEGETVDNGTEEEEATRRRRRHHVLQEANDIRIRGEGRIVLDVLPDDASLYPGWRFRLKVNLLEALPEDDDLATAFVEELDHLTFQEMALPLPSTLRLVNRKLYKSLVNSVKSVKHDKYTRKIEVQC